LYTKNISTAPEKKLLVIYPDELACYLFYYENRTQGTLKTIKKNKEQSTTG